MSLIRAKATVSIFWSVIDQSIRQGFQIIVTIVLARMLSPAEFGLIAMIGVFTALASAFIDSGFSSALIQKPELSPDDADTVFYFNVIMGLLMTLIIYASAPAIAAFYNQPMLKTMTQFMSPMLLIGSLGGIQSALLSKALDSKTQMKISAVTSIVAGTSAIIAAVSGLGAWSLIIQIAISTVLTTLLLWSWHDWRPRAVFSIKRLRTLFQYASNLLFSELLNTFTGKISVMFMGMMYSSSDLGLYNRAASTQQIPHLIIGKIYNKVAFPVFSAAAARDHAQFARGGDKIFDLLNYLTMPLMVGIMCSAPTLISVVFGAKWLPCVPYLVPLCLVGILWPFQVVHLNMLKAFGDSGLFLRLVITRHVLTLLALFLSYRISILAMTWAQFPVAIICSLLYTISTKRLLSFKMGRRWMAFLTYAACGIAMGITVTCIENFWNSTLPIFKLTIEFLFGVGVFLILTIALRVPTTFEIIKILNFRKFSSPQFS